MIAMIKHGKLAEHLRDPITGTQFRSYEFLPRVASLIVGSSGYRDHRFIEIVVQGKSASSHFNIKVGDVIFLDS